MSIKALQEKIGATPDGDFGPNTLKKAAAFFKFSKERAAHFFAQCAHETGMFESFSENLNYSKTRVVDVFRSDFDTNKDGKISEVHLKRLPILYMLIRMEMVQNLLEMDGNIEVEELFN